MIDDIVDWMGEEEMLRNSFTYDVDIRVVQTFACFLRRHTGLALLGLLLVGVPGLAADWPMWGYDAQRSMSSPAALELPETLHLQWMRELPSPRRAWRAQFDDGDKLEFDLSYSPVVKAGRVFVASMTTDSLSAYDATTGAELWRFYADGPMRLAPAAWNGRVYAPSDDGRLYCLDAASGEKLWAFDTAPSDHRVLGNERVVSMWSVRGGPVVDDGVLYLASGVWPFLGTFVYALDAETGAIVWANTGHATEWQAQPHGGAYAFGGVAPQGYLAVSKDRVVVSGGRSYPALFHREDGRLLHSQVRGAKGEGGYRVHIQDGYYFNHGRRYRLLDGTAAGSGRIATDAFDALHARTMAVAEMLDAPVFDTVVAAGRLFVSTLDGRLYCFGPEPVDTPPTHSAPSPPTEPADTPTGRMAQTALDALARHDGYALVLGASNVELLVELALRSQLHIVAIEPDAQRVASARRSLDDAGLYGSRVALLPGRFDEMHYPAYISDLVLAPDPEAAGLAPDAVLLARLYERLRPYTGRAWLGFDADSSDVQSAMAAFQPENGRVVAADGTLWLHAEGPLPDTGEWTHQHADSAQTVVSREYRVKPPFGPIWFGGPTHDNILPRHSAGPRPQVAGGRLVIMGVETISARCIYTGRELWVREFSGIGHPFTNLELEERWRAGRPVYMTNQPGATYIGSPYVTLPDAVYLRYQNHVYRLDPDSGEVVARWALPRRENGNNDDTPDWGHISVSGDTVIATTHPHIFRGGALGTIGDDSWDGSSSERLVALDRHSGEVRWIRDAKIGFRHNAIASANGRLFVNDLLSEEALGMAQRRGMDVAERPRLYCLELETGEALWAEESDVFGTFLTYSAEHDVLIEGGTRDGRRHVSDEPASRMTARRGADGTVLWTRSGRFDGPVIVLDDMIFPARPGSAINLLTGKNHQRLNPLTGEEITFSYWKTYGCGAANASPHLLLFRSGAAGFTDISGESGTGTLGGFRSGCTSSLIPADGMLNAPDYTRTCNCNYQNQTSLGLTHMPELEVWTVDTPSRSRETALERAGINLGAPGNRRDENGTFWVHFPQRAPAPDIDVALMDHRNLDPDMPLVTGVSGRASLDNRPENVFDGNSATRWRISSNRNGEFRDRLTIQLDRPIDFSEIEIAWSGPENTTFQIQARNRQDGGGRTAVHEVTGTGSGHEFETYTFDTVDADEIRLRFDTHTDMSEDRRGRRQTQAVTVHAVRIGRLPDPDAYALVRPKPMFRKHSLTVDASRDGLNYVAASGMENIRDFVLQDVNGGAQPYDVTLHFAEPLPLAPGQRVFDVKLDDRLVATGVDIVERAGAPRRAMTLRLNDVPLNDTLTLTFLPTTDSEYPPLLCGVELVRQP